MAFNPNNFYGGDDFVVSSIFALMAQEQLEKKIHIHKGNSDPETSGCFLIQPTKLLTELLNFNPLKMKFKKGDLVVVTNNRKSYTIHPNFSYRNSYDTPAPEGVILKVVDHVDYTNHPALELETLDGTENFLVGEAGVRKATTYEEIAGGFFSELELELEKTLDEAASTPYVSLSIPEIEKLHSLSSEAGQKYIEETFPNLFPRPTFRVGEIIKQVNPVRDLAIVAMSWSDSELSEILLVDTATGRTETQTVMVEEYRLNKISEKEILDAGKGFGLTRANYAKFCHEV